MFTFLFLVTLGKNHNNEESPKVGNRANFRGLTFKDNIFNSGI